MEGTIAEIRMFAGNFAPRNWAFCSGQLMSIASNTALFSLLGTTYGGNGVTTFALPDLRGRQPVGTGQGPGLTNRILGEISGTETATLLITQLPAHTHTVTNSLTIGSKAERPGTSAPPSGKYHSILAGSNAYSTTTDVNMAPIPVPNSGTAGGSQPFSKRSP